jgi:hypothetical protein
MRALERRASAGLVDTTADTLERIERNLAETEGVKSS